MRRITPMSTDDRHDGVSHQLQKLELVISGVPGKLPLKTIKRELVGSGGRHLPILLVFTKRACDFTTRLAIKRMVILRLVVEVFVVRE